MEKKITKVAEVTKSIVAHLDSLARSVTVVSEVAQGDHCVLWIKRDLPGSTQADFNRTATVEAILAILG